MATAKTGHRPTKSFKDNDSNAKAKAMASWTPRHARNQRTGGKPKGKATRKVLVPPPGGWVYGQNC